MGVVVVGARGPQKSPVQLRLVNGRSGGRDSGGRRVEEPLDFVRKAPRMPSWLPDEAKRAWKRVVPGLEKQGLLKPEDLDTLVSYCLAVWLQRQASAELQANPDGLTTPGKESMKAHPSVATLRNAQATIRAFAHEFGLTPAAESNVNRGEDDVDGKDNPFA